MYPDMVEVNGIQHQVFVHHIPANSNFIITEVLGMPIGKNISVVKIPFDYTIEIGKEDTELNIPDESICKRHSSIGFDLAIQELVI